MGVPAVPHTAHSVVKTVVYIETQGSEIGGGEGRQAGNAGGDASITSWKNDTVLQIPGGDGAEARQGNGPSKEPQGRASSECDPRAVGVSRGEALGLAGPAPPPRGHCLSQPPPWQQKVTSGD